MSDGWIKTEDMEVEDWMSMLGVDIIEAQGLTASYRQKNYNPCDTFVRYPDGKMLPSSGYGSKPECYHEGCTGMATKESWLPDGLNYPKWYPECDEHGATTYKNNWIADCFKQVNYGDFKW